MAQAAPVLHLWGGPGLEPLDPNSGPSPRNCRYQQRGWQMGALSLKYITTFLKNSQNYFLSSSTFSLAVGHSKET